MNTTKHTTNRITKHIPNALTCLNVFSGCVSCLMALEGEILLATIWIIIGSVFDFLDGFAARIFKAYSNIGKDLDSLADMVTFGMAPGMIVFWILSQAVPAIPSNVLGSSFSIIPFIAFVIPIFSALRLAKFNNDTRQTTSFIGLPVPAHALFWSSFSYSLLPTIHIDPLLVTTLVIVLAITTSILLVSEIPMFSLKINSWGWKENESRYVLLACFIISFSFFGLSGIAPTIFIYIILSIFNKEK